MDPRDATLAARCIKISWLVKQKGPKSETELEKVLTKADVPYVKCVLRKRSAVVMFASATLADKAMQAVNSKTKWKAVSALDVAAV